MESITPEQEMALIGLFMINDELVAQQQTVLRSIARTCGLSLEVEADRDGIDYALFVCNGTAIERVKELLTCLEMEVKAAVITPVGDNFYSMKHLEMARNWLRKHFSEDGGGSETMETHYLTADLMRIPHFNSWVHLLSYESAINLYLETEMLQYHKDDIIEAALKGGLYF